MEQVLDVLEEGGFGFLGSELDVDVFGGVPIESRDCDAVGEHRV